MNAKILLETSNFRTINTACQDALINHKMIGIIGQPGYGKTTALNSFMNSLQDNVVIVTVSASMSAKIFYSTIINTFGDSSYKSSEHLYFLIQKAVNMFNVNNENKLLIIDEAGKLSPKMLEYLHEFRDKTMEHTGIILAGVDYFRSNIMKWRNSGKVGIPEFCSRISSWQVLEKPTKDEIVALINAYGIKDDDFVKACLNINELRTLTNHIQDYLTFLTPYQN